MNLEFMNLVLDKCEFPEDAKVYFRDLADSVIAQGLEAEFDSIVDTYFECGFSSGKMDEILLAFKDKAGNHSYSYWMLMLLLATERAKPLYDKRGVSEEVFWDTFTDLRSKSYECKEIYGYWGTFVGFWYGLFMRCAIIKFGRLEYQDTVYDNDTPRIYGDVKVEKGRRMLGIHIPSNAGPLDYESRMKSYKMAYDFYSKELGQTDALVCDCGSWLLYPPYKNAFHKNSNVVDFMKDFDICHVHDDKPGDFGDAWRLFGDSYQKPLEEWYEDTSMRRSFKKYFLDGGLPGEGFGYLVFDGEKLLTRKED